MLGVSIANNYAADKAYATAFSTELKRSLTISNLHLAVSLADIGDIEVTGVLYSNDPAITRKLVLSFNARR